MSQDFEQKALRLVSKLNNISQNANNNLYEVNHQCEQISRNENSHYSKHRNSPLNELEAFRREVECSQEEKSRKNLNLQGEISKLQNYLLEENQARSTISENFISTAKNVENNMKNALSIINKSFEERQKKINIKISDIISQEVKQLETNIAQSQALIKYVESLSEQVTSLEEELEQMKKSRYILEEKIYKQFVDQLKELKMVHDRDVRQREERQASIVECMKGVYTSLMGEIRKEEAQREVNEKGFLTVIEQLIDRIVQA